MDQELTQAQESSARPRATSEHTDWICWGWASDYRATHEPWLYQLLPHLSDSREQGWSQAGATRAQGQAPQDKREKRSRKSRILRLYNLTKLKQNKIRCLLLMTYNLDLNWVVVFWTSLRHHVFSGGKGPRSIGLSCLFSCWNRLSGEGLRPTGWVALLSWPCRTCWHHNRHCWIFISNLQALPIYKSLKFNLIINSWK